MDRNIAEEIAYQAALGRQSPMHAIRATENISRLMSVPRVGPENTVSQMIDPDATIRAHDDVRPASAQQLIQPHMRAPMHLRPEMVAPLPPVTAPTQIPPVMNARNHPPSYAQIVQPEIAPDIWLVVPGIPIVDPVSETVGIRLPFVMGDLLIVGMRGTTRFTDLDTPDDVGKTTDAWVAMKFTINGQENLITNGQAEDWAFFSDLFTPSVQWTPVLRQVVSTDIAQFMFRNFSTTHTAKISLLLGCRRLPMPIANPPHYTVQGS